MLMSVQMNPVDPLIKLIAEMNKQKSDIVEVRGGYYLSGSWNLEHSIRLPKSLKIETFPSNIPDENGSYGVCDSVEQFHEKVGRSLESSDRLFVVNFVEIRKDLQESEGGWRWHKWGEYIGEQTPTCEYIYDEPLITKVFTYQVLEVLKTT